MPTFEFTDEEIEVLLWGLGWGLSETKEHSRTPIAEELEERLKAAWSGEY